MFTNRSVLVIVLVIVLGATVALSAGSMAAETSTGGFEVSISETNAPIFEGEELVVIATITNTGVDDDSQQIHLKDPNNDIVDSIAHPPLTLGPGESQQVTLTWETEPGGAETVTFSVHSNDDVDERTTVIKASDSDGDGSSDSDEDGSSDSDEDGSSDSDEDGSSDSDGDGSSDSDGDGSSDSDNGNTTDSGDSSDTSSSSSGGLTWGHLISDRSNSLVEGTVANVSGHDIDRVEFDEPIDGQISVDKFRHLPKDVGDLDDVLAVYRIEVPDGAINTSATVTLTLDSAVLEGADADELLVMQWNGEEWTALDTSATANDGTVTIEFRTHGFGLFAITTGNETSDSTIPGALVVDADATPTPTESPSSSPDSTSPDTPASNTGSVTDDQEVPGFGVVLTALALLLTGLYGSRRRSR